MVKTRIGFLVSSVLLIMEMVRKGFEKQPSCDLGKNVRGFHSMSHLYTKGHF